MSKVDTAGLIEVNVLEDRSALVGVFTSPFVHSRTHKNPAVKRSTAANIDALWEYCHSLFESRRRTTMIHNIGQRAYVPKDENSRIFFKGFEHVRVKTIFDIYVFAAGENHGNRGGVYDAWLHSRKTDHTSTCFWVPCHVSDIRRRRFL